MVTTTVAGMAESTSVPDSGLSSGAKAGIGVGVSLGVIGLLTLLAGIWMMARARRREKDLGTAAMAQRPDEHDPRYPAGYGGWAVETSATPVTKMATTTGTDGGHYNGTSPQSGYSQGPYGMGAVTSPSQFGGSTIGGTPVELAEDRPTELPVNTNYKGYSEGAT
jgi:hypothetical protein